MIAKSYISQNLEQLEAAYRKASHPKYKTYLSKLAILELCGWVEMSMDQIVEDHAKKNLREPKNLADYKKTIKRTYGFEYEMHFRKLLINLIGLINFENIEQRIQNATHVKFISELSNLKTIRDKQAHTYLKGPAATLTIDSPLVTKQRFSYIHAGLKQLELELKKI